MRTEGKRNNHEEMVQISCSRSVGITDTLCGRMRGSESQITGKSNRGIDSAYTDGKEKKVKECYNQADNTEADLQTEITATLKYFAAHNPKKVSVQDCEILSENDKYSYVYITYNLILEDDQEYPCVETYMVGKQDKTYYIMAPSQITDDMKTQAATAYVQFMKTDAYKTYTKAYETFIKKNPGYEDKISEKAGV
mgnify:CR=1 FL=1